MAKSKYDYRLDSLKILDGIKKLFEGLSTALNSEQPERFSIVQRGMSLIARHNDSNGKFFFHITINPDESFLQKTTKNNKVSFRLVSIDSKPYYQWHRKFALISKNPQSYQFNVENLEVGIFEWLKHVSEYEQLELPNTLLTTEEQYTEEFFFELKLTDPKADTQPFPLKTQLALDAYLEDAIVITEQEQVATGEDYSEIIEAARDLKHSQTQLSQNETLKKLSEIFAKARMKSIPFLKKLFENATIALLVEVGKKLLGI